MTSPSIRPAIRNDLAAWYGDDIPKHSMRALVVDLGGRILGITGLIYHQNQMLAFSAMDDDMRQYPVTIMKVAKRMAQMIEQHGRNVIAVASSEEKNSDAFLKRIGFEFIGETSDGRVYRWQTR